jgi:membrane carboxypeptidase/penicillin-binding protein
MRRPPLSTSGARTRAQIKPYDVIYVKVVEPQTAKQSVRVEMRVRPTVQGVAVVLDNKTGRVLAMVGGFSYPLSQLNRVTQSRRQPGSSFKPMTYLAALNNGLQPNTLVQDAPITYPPIGGVNRYTRATDYWSPHNYDQGYAGTMTLRRALEQSKNLVTARLLNGGVADDPPDSLDAICHLAQEAHVYPTCIRFYPFVLGAQPVRPIDLAGFYAAIANEGKRPTPHVIESISQDGQQLYKADESLKPLEGIDPANVFQIRSILQGVVARGTAIRISALSPYIAGKTGTSDEFNDAWFMGISADVTIGVWVGYDNAKGKRTLGPQQAGSRVALPIFERIIKAVWSEYAPQRPLPGPSPEAARHLVSLPIDLHSGQRIDSTSRSRSEEYYPGQQRADGRNRGAFMEYFYVDDSGRLKDEQYRLVSRHDYSIGDDSGGSNPVSSFFQSFWGSNLEGAPTGPSYQPGARVRRGTMQRDYEGKPFYQPPPRFPDDMDDDRPARRGARREPGAFWGGRPGY